MRRLLRGIQRRWRVEIDVCCYAVYNMSGGRFAVWYALLAEPPLKPSGIPVIWALPSNGTVCGFENIGTPLYAFFEYCISNARSAAVEPTCQAATSASAVTVWFKGDGQRSLLCRIVYFVVASNSEGAGCFDSRTEVADVDGVNCWGPTKTRETLNFAGDCFEGARNLCIGFLFRSRVVITVQVTTLDSTKSMFDWYMPTIGQAYVHQDGNTWIMLFEQTSLHLYNLSHCRMGIAKPNRPSMYT